MVARDRRKITRCSNRAIGLAALAGTAIAMGGCEADSWLGAPNALGRWEHTPTIVPVLERIDVIEADAVDFVEPTPIMPDDLVPSSLDYRIASGDVLRVTILDFLEGGQPFDAELQVDSRGAIDIPQLGRIRIGGLSSLEAQELIARMLVDGGFILRNPTVSIQVPAARQQTFSILGAVQAVGTYAIPNPDYRLLEALTDAGGVSPTIRNVFVIRQVPLSDRASGVIDPVLPSATPTRPADTTGGSGSGDDLLDLIDEVTQPNDNPSPGARDWVSMSAVAQPGEDDDITSALLDQPNRNPNKEPQGREPILDLPDDSPVNTTSPFTTPSTTPTPITAAPAGRWMFLNGKWVQVMSPTGGSSGLPEGADPLAGAQSLDELVTQRVIKVPVKPLLQGAASYNIVVRPGDIIHVPPPEQGFVYADGPGISQAGVYQLPTAGQLTLRRLVASAGGLSQLANANRVDLTRRIGEDRQAIIRLDLKAIAEGTQPDIVLKADDLVTFGTDFWATPLAVLRSGIRATYGFGFLLDRNFGNDVFGSPPVNRFGN
ncbi:MAG: polysaccharide biosynthesis/export family protein [Phycisphaerales bacterium]|nr:polysaccharide biosynthesis/export family protein [Phycisphaerales bacterium]